MASAQGSADKSEAHFKNKLKLAKFCTVCKDVFKHGAGHRSRQGHTVVKLSDEQRKQVLAELMAEGDEQKKLVEQRRQQTREGWKVDTAEDCNIREYRLDFGKHKGLTIAGVMAKDPGYLKVLLSMNTHHARPDFKQALEDANLLESLVKEGKAHSKKNVGQRPAHFDVIQ